MLRITGGRGTVGYDRVPLGTIGYAIGGCPTAEGLFVEAVYGQELRVLEEGDLVGVLGVVVPVDDGTPSSTGVGQDQPKHPDGRSESDLILSLPCQPDELRVGGESGIHEGESGGPLSLSHSSTPE